MSKIRSVFFGTPDFAAKSLEALCASEDTKPCLVVTQPDKPAGRGGKLKAPPVKVLAETYNIPVLQPKRLRNNQEFLAEIKALGKLDICIVVAFGQIIPSDLLELPEFGFVNVHASLLPRWRGAAPIQRALLAGDAKTGVGIMAMDEGLDTGAVYATSETEITTADNLETLHDRLAELGAKCLLETLPKIVAAEIKAVPQAQDGVEYARKIENDEAAIDWKRSAEELDRQIRAFSPIPGAFSHYEGKRIKIFKATPKCSRGANFAAGVVSFSDGKSVLEVSCGSGVLALEELQLEGKRRMSVSDFLLGNRISVGTEFV